MFSVWKSSLTVVGFLLMTACSAANESAAPRASAPEPPHVNEGDDACGAARVQDRVGRDFDAAMGMALREESGAKTLRVMRPGEAHTLDYRTERLNVRLDDRDRISALECG
ncbi:I78 family peptidase inhibitor [Halomonas daqiaonensis]|uniref:Peptidase inhibitor I78 family protein n=1 Tax=Halomonas daqiaonensis TaxID=650850 RepID=A0A1H7RCF7_9GAMM|nr:I78 family peptidase inhibitor [Halomonas daqiaonensis]SEL57594.1 Peptidase inhibitor I78 family protein [Halomonas daqiaonensis]